MAKTRFVLVLALLVLCSTSAFATSSRTTFYYSDATFTTIVGAHYIPAYDCPDTDHEWWWGATTNYRKIYFYSECDEGGTVIIRCFIGSTLVTCP